ncbi:MAG: hypothetical protein MJK04_23100 [Psychrosphaera sp.]|nr:hypothetical protein [Psychrosphaera sp.]
MSADTIININTTITVLAPKGRSYQMFIEAKPALFTPFSADCVDFVSEFSHRLMTDSRAKSFGDLIALAYWFRKAHLNQLKQDFVSQNQGSTRVARGLAFHITPANVDTMFVYSMFLSLLMGNSNIVRVSSKKSPSSNPRQAIIIDVLNLLLSDTDNPVAQSVLIISYPHNSQINDQLSKLADIRLIWGGDQTIKTLSQSQTKPSGVDLKFVDKYSSALIDATALNDADEPTFNALISHFVNDAYSYGQQACSSPRTVFWLNGEAQQPIIERFWQAVDGALDGTFDHGIQTADQINKITVSQQLAIDYGVIFKSVNHRWVTCVEFTEIPITQAARAKHCGNGLFYQVALKRLADLPLQLADNEQTLSYFGFDRDEINQALEQASGAVDRIVPIGSALTFSTVWDGYDLINSLSREIVIL